MVHCRNWNFSGFVPEEGLVLEVTWQKHRNLESRAEHPSECCSKGCSSFTRAAEGSATGSVCPAQPQTPLQFPGPSFPHRDADSTGTQQNDGAGGCQVSSLPSLQASDEWSCSKGFYHMKGFTQAGNSLEAEGVSLLNALCCG